MTLLRRIMTLVLSICGGALACGAVGAEGPAEAHATGCRPPTEAERQWERQHMIVTRRVRLNTLGLARVNAERLERLEIQFLRIARIWL